MPAPQSAQSEKAVEAYKRQALRCLNGLLGKIGIPATLTSEVQVTFDIIQQLACVYFRVPAIPSGSSRPGGASQAGQQAGPEQAILTYIMTKLGIDTRHISAKGLHENNVFDCMLLLEIVYTLLKSDDMPLFPQMTEEIASAILQQQQDAATRDLMEMQADYMERAERRKDPKGILGARAILDTYADKRAPPPPAAPPALPRAQGRPSPPPEQGEAPPRPRPDSSRPGGRPGTAGKASMGRGGAPGSPGTARSQSRQQEEILQMVDDLYESYLRDWVDKLHPIDPRNPQDRRVLAARDHDQKRVKGKLYRLVTNVMQEIHRKELDSYYRLQLRIQRALDRATVIERENLRLEAQARRDEAERLRHEEWKTQVALETRRQNEMQMRKERAEEAARVARINRESNLREQKTQQSRREDELFDRIAAALQRESDRRLRNAVENFDLSEDEIDRIVVARLREYAGAERAVTDGAGDPGSARPRV